VRSFDKISFVPIEKRNDSRLLAKEAEIMNDMENSDERIAVCVHEAAHGVYYRRLGATSLQYHPPRATYLPDSDTFRCAYAAIQGFGYPRDRIYDLRDSTKPYVAGGAAIRVFGNFPQPKVSDESDKERFLADAHADFPDFTDDELEQYWQNAIVEVEQELQDEVLQIQIWEGAYHFQAWLLADH
jgi:hypothetical protein